MRLEAQAFNLYTFGTALDSIAKQCGVAYQTIRNWKTKYKWVKRKKDIEKETQERQKEVIIEFKENQLKIVMGLIAQTVNDVKSNQRGTAKDYLALLEKFEQLTKGEEVFPEEIEAEVQKRVCEYLNKLREAIRKGEPIPDVYFPTKDKGIGTITIHKPTEKDNENEEKEDEEEQEELENEIYV